jgi:predicted  nucleic acid-binding Zn-ribbon protein
MTPSRTNLLKLSVDTWLGPRAKVPEGCRKAALDISLLLIFRHDALPISDLSSEPATVSAIAWEERRRAYARQGLAEQDIQRMTTDFAAFRASTDAQLAAVQKQHAADVQRLTSEHSAAVATLNATHDRDIAAVRAEATTSLAAAIASLRHELNSALETAAASLLTATSRNEARIASNESAISSLVSKVAILDSTAKALSGKLETVSDDLGQTRSRQAALTARVAETETHLSAVDERFFTAERRLDALESGLEGTTAVTSTVQRAVSVLSDNVQAATRVVQAFHRRLDSVEAAFKQNVEEIAEALDTDLRAFTSATAATLTSRVEGLIGRVDATDRASCDAKAAAEAAASAGAAAEQAAQSSQAAATSALEEVSALRGAVDSTAASLSALQTAYASTARAVADVRAAADTNQADLVAGLASAAAATATLTSSHGQTAHSLSEALAELTQISAAHDETAKSLQTVTGDHKQLSSRVAALASSLSAADKGVASLRNDLSALSAQAQATADAAMAAREDVARVDAATRSALDRAESTITDATRRLDETSAFLDTKAESQLRLLGPTDEVAAPTVTLVPAPRADRAARQRAVLLPGTAASTPTARGATTPASPTRALGPSEDEARLDGLVWLATNIAWVNPSRAVSALDSFFDWALGGEVRARRFCHTSLSQRAAIVSALEAIDDFAWLQSPTDTFTADAVSQSRVNVLLRVVHGLLLNDANLEVLASEPTATCALLVKLLSAADAYSPSNPAVCELPWALFGLLAQCCRAETFAIAFVGSRSAGLTLLDQYLSLPPPNACPRSYDVFCEAAATLRSATRHDSVVAPVIASGAFATAIQSLSMMLTAGPRRSSLTPQMEMLAAAVRNSLRLPEPATTRLIDLDGLRVLVAVAKDSEEDQALAAAGKHAIMALRVMAKLPSAYQTLSAFGADRIINSGTSYPSRR